MGTCFHRFKLEKNGQGKTRKKKRKEEKRNKQIKSSLI
jgi:hypothetical protein